MRMKQRVLAGGAAVGIAAVLVVVALVTGSGGGGPRTLPVLGASGVGEPASADAMSSPVGGGGGPGYEFTGDAGGLATEADAWSVDRADSEARARVLAEALGVGELVENGEQWTAESADGFLTVDRQPGLPWYYSAVVAQVDPVPPDTPVSSDGTVSSGTVSPEDKPGATGGGTDAVTCADGDPACSDPPSEEPTCAPQEGCAPPSDQGQSSTGSSASGSCETTDDTDDTDTCGPVIDCAMPECPPGAACIQSCPETGPAGTFEPLPMPQPERPSDLPSAEEAEAIARGFLDDAGMSLDGARTRVDDGFSSWVFVADPVVGGLPTFGMTTAVGVGSGGVVEFANGWLDDPVERDTYDLVGVDLALERLAESGGWVAYSPGAPEPAACESCDEPVVPEPIVLDSIEVGLQLVPAYGADEAWLVPSYLFTIADGGPGAVVAAFAIADDLLVAPQVDEPSMVDGGDSGPIPVEPDGGIGDGAGPPTTSGEEATVAPLPEGERAEIGVGYYLEVSTHCGVQLAAFDGRLWDASPVLGDGNPPPGWAEPTEGGTMTLLGPDEAEFVGDGARTKVARFVSRPADAAPPAGCD